MALSDQLLDHYLAHRLGLIGFENKTVREVVAILERAERELLGEIASAYTTVLEKGGGIGGATPWDGRGLKFKMQSLRRVQAALADANKAMSKVLLGAANGTAKTEAQLLAEVLGDILPKPVIDTMQLSRVPTRQLAALVDDKFGKTATGSVKSILTEFDQIGARANTNVATAIQRAISDGATLPTTTRAVKEALGIAKHQAAAYVRTVIQESANDAARMLHQENADLVRAEQFVATLDSDTCPRCGALDGTVAELVRGNTTIQRPPIHVNCRCFVVPVLRTWKQIGLPDSIPGVVKTNLNGRRAERTTWKQWVQKKPERLDIVLGPARAKLFREGRADFDDFVSRTRILRLDEIKTHRRRAA